MYSIKILKLLKKRNIILENLNKKMKLKIICKKHIPQVHLSVKEI